MFSKKEELISLIKKEIEQLKKEKENQLALNHGLIELRKDLENVESIIYVKLEELKGIVYKLNIDDKDRLYKELKTIRRILTMNKDYKSTLRLFKKDKEAYRYFLDNFDKLNEKLAQSDPKIEELDSRISKYNSLIENILQDKFKITTCILNLLEPLFKDNSDASVQQILIELIEYENSCFKTTLSSSKKKNNKEIDDSELTELFKEYSYDYSELADYYKALLKTHGNLKNIRGIFKKLLEYQFPKINDQYVLTSILLGSNADTIEKVTLFARENHLIPKALLDLSGALLIQNDNNKTDDYSIMTTGSSVDFMKNIMTLKNADLNLNYIYQGCKCILTMPNALLEKNLDLFCKYGFSFEHKRKGVIDPAPCALMSKDFAAIADAFIEIHPLGLKYLMDNLSNLKTVSNKDALMFYNIYMSNKESKGNIDDPEDGPFRLIKEDGEDNYQLKAIITRNRPDLRGTYYKDINDETKFKVTNTIIPEIEERSSYDRIIDKCQNIPITNSIFSNPYIVSINKYIDYDSPLIYNFDGIIISRLKVLRIYNILLKNGIEDSLDSLLYAITYNTIISSTDYSKIYNCVKKEIEAGD